MRESINKENEERAVLKGALLVPAWALVRKSWARKFCVLFDTSPQGVRRLEIFDSEEHLTKGHSGKIIVLEDTIKIHNLPKTNRESNVFEITTEKRAFQLRAENAKEVSEWVEKLRKVCFPEKQSIGSMDNKDATSTTATKTNGYSVKENDLYGEVDDTFPVRLISTPASEKCQLNPSELNYAILLTPDSMILKFGDMNNFYVNDDSEDKLIYEWHYPFIRRYGIVNGFFSFEAGRKCPSGEGLFSFDAPDVRKIFERLASFMKIAGEKRKQLKTSSSPTVQDDIQANKTDKEKVPQDENCEGCKKLSNGGSPDHQDHAIMFGRACAVPQTPITTAVYANVSDPDPVNVNHIVVGDGVEYARIVKSPNNSAPPPPPPPIQKTITRMESIEQLQDGVC